jgi:hypothetical protein
MIKYCCFLLKLLGSLGLLIMTAATATAANTDIKVISTSQCMDVYGGSQSVRAEIIQWGCHGRANQQWQLRQTDGYYMIVAAHSGLCLGIENTATQEGAHVTQRTCDAGTNQTWQLSLPVSRQCNLDKIA